MYDTSFYYVKELLDPEYIVTQLILNWNESLPSTIVLSWRRLHAFYVLIEMTIWVQKDNNARNPRFD